MAVTHRSLSIAVESSFGSLSATTGLPVTTGLTYTSTPCDRDWETKELSTANESDQ